jgi:hypothetical protein
VKERCPRCGSRDVQGGKITLLGKGDGGSSVTIYERHCNNCGRADEVSTNEAGWESALELWEQQEGTPRTLDVQWLENLNADLEAIVNTTSGKQRWTLTVNGTEPRYTLYVDGRIADRIPTEAWPPSWTMTNGRRSPHDSV